MKKIVLGLILTAVNVFSNPSGEKVVSGEAAFSRNDNNLKISQGTDKAIVNWDSFSIGRGEKTIISQPSSSSILLNRVVGQTPTSIEGMLEANGHIYLINPKGIMVGKEGVIKTAGFLASTLNIKDSDFLSGIKKFESDTFATFENKGIIESKFGDIYIVASDIKNSGSIKAKSNAALIAASDIYIVSDNKNLIIQVEGEGYISQEGMVEAAKVNLKAAGGDLSNLAINQKGIIKASIIEEKGGEIFLSSEKGTVEVSGKIIAKKDDLGGLVHILGENVGIIEKAHIDASGDNGGGTILIGGDYQGKNPDIKNATCTFVDRDALIEASANIEGDGGRVIVWADGKTTYLGQTIATGGVNSGDGGFIEISGKNDLDYRGNIDLTANIGKTGTLLLDPSSINITNTSPSNPAFANPYDPNSDPATANLYVVDLTTALGAADVIVTTLSGASAVNGSITVSTEINWSADTSLTLLADRDLDVNARIINTNVAPTTSPIISLQGGLNRDGGNNAVDGITLATLAPLYTVQTNGGDIEIKGTGIRYGVNVIGEVNSNTGNVDITGTSVGTGNDRIGLNISATTGKVITTSGNISLIGNGSNNGTGQNNVGFYGRTASTIESTSGNIYILGNGGAGSTGSNRGMRLYGAINNTNGNIDLVGKVNPNVTGNANVGILMESTSSILVDGTGSISLDGGKRISPAVATAADSNTGVRIDGGTIKIYNVTPVADTGSITILGTSENATGRNNHGFLLNGVTAEVSSNGRLSSVIGNIFINGTGADIATALPPPLPDPSIDTNVGVYINISTISSLDSDIIINGNGGSGTYNNRGIYLNSATIKCATYSYPGPPSVDYIPKGSIALTGKVNRNVNYYSNVGIDLFTSIVSVEGTGSISLDGGKRISTPITTATDSNCGVQLSGAHVKIFSSPAAADTGSITIEGISVSSSGNSNHGVSLAGSSEISSNGTLTSSIGDIDIKGTAGGSSTGDTNYGVFINTGGKVTTVDSDVIINGTGGAGTTQLYGCNLVGSYCESNGAGNINITGAGGAGGAGANASGIYLLASAYLSSTSSGDIIVKGYGGTYYEFTPAIHPEGNQGVKIERDSYITTSGLGRIDVEGVGGDGTNAGGLNAEKCYGIFLYDGSGTDAKITSTSTGITGDQGSITLNGTAGKSNGLGHGIYLVTSKIETNEGYVLLTGTGTAIVGTVSSNNGVILEESSHITSVPSLPSTTCGNITINGYGGKGASLNYGIFVSESYIQTDGTGEIYLNGIGKVSNFAGGNNHGIALGLPGETGTRYIKSTASGMVYPQGRIRLHGEGGIDPDIPSIVASAANNGVFIQCDIETVSGAIEVVGIGHGTQNSNIGVRLTDSGFLKTTGDGTIYVEGTGGTGVYNNHGISLEIDTSITSTDASSTLGTITLIGTGGSDGSQGYSVGLFLEDQAKIETENAIIDINGTGGPGQYNNYGVGLRDTSYIKSNGSGNIFIEGNGGGSISSPNEENFGVYLYNGTKIAAPSPSTASIEIKARGGPGTTENAGLCLKKNINASYIETSSGDIDIEAIGGDGTSFNYGMWLENSYIDTDSGKITINATGNGSTNSNHGVFVQNTADPAVPEAYIKSTSGSIDIIGTGTTAATPGQDNNYGLFFDDAYVETANADITLKGISHGLSDFNNGVVVAIQGSNPNAYVKTTGAGNILIEGTCNSSSGGQNTGVIISTADVTVNEGIVTPTYTGDITISGTGGAGTTNNIGISVDDSNIFTDNGTIKLTGIGRGSTTVNRGVSITSSSTIKCLGSTGSIDIEGTGGIDPAGTFGTDSNHGIIINNSSIIETIDGNISLNGYGNGTGNSIYGIIIANSSKIESTGSGNVYLVGIGGGIYADTVLAQGGNIGVYQNISSNVYSNTGFIDIEARSYGNQSDNEGYRAGNNSWVRSTTGDIDIRGYGGDGVNENYGIIFSTASCRALGGKIQLTGYGGDGSGEENYGVFLFSVSGAHDIISGDNLEILGYGGDGGTTDNYGVYVINTPIDNTGGDVIIEGFGGDGSDQNYGVYFENSGVVNAAGITRIKGTGGEGANRNYGVYFNNSSDLDLGSLTVEITGNVVRTTGNNNHAVYFNSSDIVVDRNINVLGTVHSIEGSNNYGIYLMDSKITSSLTDSLISLQGEGGGGTGTTFSSNHGIRIEATAPTIAIDAKNISLQGNGSSRSGVGVYFDNVQIIANNSGYLDVLGYGGTGDKCNGVFFDTASSLYNSTGNISCIGYGGEGTATDTGDNNGISIKDGSFIESTSGRISLLGVGGTGVDAAEDQNYGIFLFTTTTPSSIKSTTGNIILDGTGGGKGTSNYGVYAASSSSISATSGDIKITGVGSADENLNEGINISNGSAVTTTTGDIIFIGEGKSGINHNYGIYISGSDVNSIDGTIDFKGGIETSTASGSINNGIYLTNSSTVETTGSGHISITGITGSSASDNSYGAYIFNSTIESNTGNIILSCTSNAIGLQCIGCSVNGSTIQSTSGLMSINATAGTGFFATGLSFFNSTIVNKDDNIEFTGTGGQSSAAPGDLSYGMGIIIDSTSIDNNTGDIILQGSAQSDGQYNIGLYVYNATAITANTSGNVTLEGTTLGGNGSYNYGIWQDTGTSVIANTGQITCTGTGGLGSNDNAGMLIAGDIYSSTGSIDCSGYGGGSGTGVDNHGIEVDGNTYSTAGGTVSLTGEGGSGTSSNHGIFLDNTSFGSAATGSLTLKGKEGTGTSSYGIYLDNTPAQTSQNMFLIATSIEIEDPSPLTATNNIYTRPYLDNGSMDIGFDAGGDLALDEDTLEKLVNSTYDYFYFGQPGYGSDIIIGDDLGTTLSLDKGKVVFSGNDITIRNPIDAGIYDIKCEVGNTFPSTFKADELVTTTGTFRVVGYVYNDVFMFPVLGQEASVDGGAGSNYLHVGSEWYLIGTNAGTVDNIDYVNIQNLMGGDNDDVFKFADQASIDGIIDGGGGYNILDYSEYTTPVFVDIPAHIATGTNGIYHINGYIPPNNIIPVFPDSITQDFTSMFLGMMATNFDYFYKFSPYYIYSSIYLAFSDAEFIEIE